MYPSVFIQPSRIGKHKDFSAFFWLYNLLCERGGVHLNANFTQLLRESTNDFDIETMQIEYILKITSRLGYSFGITGRNTEIALIRSTQF